MKVELRGRRIQRNKVGDPHFVRLETPADDITQDAVLDVFTPDEVVELVNRALYQLEYQHTAHRQRAQRLRDAEKPVKLMVRRMFNVPWSKATDEQVRLAAEAVNRERETQS